MEKKYLQGYEDLTEATKTTRRWYIEIYPAKGIDCDPPYIIQSNWFDKREDAIKWADEIDYKDKEIVGGIALMYADWYTDENGEETYDDIDQDKVLRK